jgi:hypothetical protein
MYQPGRPLFRDIGHYYLAAATTSPTDGSAQRAAFSGGQHSVLDGDQRRFEEIARVDRRKVA